MQLLAYGKHFKHQTPRGHLAVTKRRYKDAAIRRMGTSQGAIARNSAYLQEGVGLSLQFPKGGDEVAIQKRGYTVDRDEPTRGIARNGAYLGAHLQESVGLRCSLH